MWENGFFHLWKIFPFVEKSFFTDELRGKIHFSRAHCVEKFIFHGLIARKNGFFHLWKKNSVCGKGFFHISAQRQNL